MSLTEKLYSAVVTTDLPANTSRADAVPTIRMDPHQTAPNQSVRVIVIVGGPGSGKSSLGKWMQKCFGFRHISTGDIFRSLPSELQTSSKDHVERLVMSTLRRFILETALGTVVVDGVRELGTFQDKMNACAANIDDKRSPPCMIQLSLIIELACAAATMEARIKSRGRRDAADGSKRVTRFLQRKIFSPSSRQNYPTGVKILHIDAMKPIEEYMMEDGAMDTIAACGTRLISTVPVAVLRLASDLVQKAHSRAIAEAIAAAAYPQGTPVTLGGAASVPREPLQPSTPETATNVDAARTIQLGVYFGSFDPIHENHVAVAQHALDYCGIDRVVFVANASVPTKPTLSSLAVREQLMLARLDAAPGMAVFIHASDPIELDASSRPAACTRIANELCACLGIAPALRASGGTASAHTIHGTSKANIPEPGPGAGSSAVYTWKCQACTFDNSHANQTCIICMTGIRPILKRDQQNQSDNGRQQVTITQLVGADKLQARILSFDRASGAFGPGRGYGNRRNEFSRKTVHKTKFLVFPRQSHNQIAITIPSYLQDVVKIVDAYSDPHQGCSSTKIRSTLYDNSMIRRATSTDEMAWLHPGVLSLINSDGHYSSSSAASPFVCPRSVKPFIILVTEHNDTTFDSKLGRATARGMGSIYATFNVLDEADLFAAAMETPFVGEIEDLSSMFHQYVYSKFERFMRSTVEAGFCGGFVIEYNVPTGHVKNVLSLLDEIGVNLMMVVSPEGNGIDRENTPRPRTRRPPCSAGTNQTQHTLSGKQINCSCCGIQIAEPLPVVVGLCSLCCMPLQSDQRLGHSSKSHTDCESRMRYSRKSPVAEFGVRNARVQSSGYLAQERDRMCSGCSKEGPFIDQHDFDRFDGYGSKSAEKKEVCSESPGADSRKLVCGPAKQDGYMSGVTTSTSKSNTEVSAPSHLRVAGDEHDRPGDWICPVKTCGDLVFGYRTVRYSPPPSNHSPLATNHRHKFAAPPVIRMGFTMLLGLKPGHMCDVISVVAESMVDFAWG
jgi:nicotinic acid mononucleotide adenylyltransferase